MDYTIFDFLGNIGAFFLVGSYLLLQCGKIASEAPLFSLLNMLAGLCVCLSLWHSFNLSAFIVEAAWALISLYGLCKFFCLKKHRP